MKERLEELRENNQLLEAQRLEQRTNYDIEMLLEMGYCNGIENYSRHMDGRKPGEAPYTLLDFFPEDALYVGWMSRILPCHKLEECLMETELVKNS